MKKVTVFGGSQPTEQDYRQAERLGQLLGQAGCTVLTGGYIGTMEAVSRGAAESGAHVIGVTCDQIEAWRDQRPNAWVQEERRFPTLLGRMAHLIENCEAALALPGGPGTLAELSLRWSLLLTRSIPACPLILIGPGWQETFQQIYRSFDSYIPSRQREWLSFAADVEAAVKQLKL